MRFISAIVIVVLVGAAIFGIYHLVVLFSNINEQVDDVQKTTTETSSSAVMECNENVTGSEPCFGLVMITRNEWVAQPSHNKIGKLKLPANRIILTDTKTEECSNKPQCKYLVRVIQGDHMMTKDDIEYNFLISTQGDVYEGRGWSLQSGEPAIDLKADSYLIGLIGNFSLSLVWKNQTEAVYRFAERALAIGKLNTKFGIYCSEGVLMPVNETINKFVGNYTQCLNTFIY